MPKSNAQPAIIALGGFVLLIALFYAEEDWRGKRAWENCKRELEARGAVLDWDKFIPPPVPDDQNFFKAPKMTEWFVKSRSANYTNELEKRLTHANTNALVLAELTILPESPLDSANAEKADIIMRYDSFGKALFPEGSNWVGNADSLASSAVANIPLIQFQDVPITTAIENLTRQAGIHFLLDPKIGYGKPGQDGQIKPEPVMSLRIENVTARQMLLAVLDNYELELVDNPQTGIALITEKRPKAEAVNEQSGLLPVSINNTPIPLIEFENVPVTKAIENLARQSGINYLLDPKIGRGTPDENGQIEPEPTVSARWTNSFSEQVLLAILNKYNSQLIYDPKTRIARITTKPPNAPQVYAVPVVREQLTQLIESAIGTNAIGPEGFALLAKSPAQIQPARIVLQSEKTPDDGDVIALFTRFFPNRMAKPGSPRIHVEPAGTNSFLVILDADSAADYLAWSDQFKPDFDLIREALKRPYARMDGDYSDPTGIPIPNLVSVRMVAQMLAQRAQCYLLLYQPENALGELSLLNDSHRLLEGAPTGKPITLVAAMINVAVAGLYTDAIADGLRLKAWKEPQLIALQKRLKEINLPPFVAEALHEEQAGSCRIIEIRALENKKNPKFPPFWPRGWIYQNMVSVATLDQLVIDSFNPTKGLIAPPIVDASNHEIETKISHFSPYKVFAAILIRNFTRAAIQTTVHNQSLVNEGQIACALERYRLAHGDYPPTLDALSSEFIEKLPHDIIGGQPLHYCRTGDGKFLLYSVGWNRTDDGGIASDKMDQDDWVWKN